MSIDPGTASVAVMAIFSVGGTVKDFVQRAAGPLADEVGELLAQRLRDYRRKNARDVITSAAGMLNSVGEEPSEVPPRNLLPILDGASLEDDPGMKERWAALLANAARHGGRTIRPVYASTLAQLAPVDAIVLQTLSDLQSGVWPEEDGWGVPYLRVMSTVSEAMRGDVLASLDTLRGLGLINAEPSVRLSKGGVPVMTERAGIALSNLGRQFLDACSPPTTSNGSVSTPPTEG